MYAEGMNAEAKALEDAAEGKTSPDPDDDTSFKARHEALGVTVRVHD